MPSVARVSQIAAEVLISQPSTARVTQVSSEVLLSTPSTARLTRVAVEVVYDAKLTHETSGDLSGTGSQINGLSVLMLPPPLNTINFMFVL